jgi:hypothetical protein
MRSAAAVDPSSAELRRRRIVAHALFVATVLMGAALLLWPPMQGRFYPTCPIHQYFGILCPGCGATRALSALLRGRFMEALRLNSLFVLLLPALLVLAMESYRRALRSGSFYWPQPPAAALYTTLAAAAIFTVARNLP